ncbi:MAG: hypothetical protein ACRC62_26475 [Microcoleus sp.]
MPRYIIKIGDKYLEWSTIVEKFGTSCTDGELVGSFLKLNRAGPKEAPLSIANIRKAWCDRLPIFVWARGNQYRFNLYNGDWEEINRFIVTVNGKYFDWDMNIDKPLTIGLSLDEFNKYYHRTYPPKLVRRLTAHSEALSKTGVSCSLYASWRDVLSFNKAGPEGTALSINQFKKYIAIIFQLSREWVINDISGMQIACNGIRFRIINLNFCLPFFLFPNQNRLPIDIFPL